MKNNELMGSPALAYLQIIRLFSNPLGTKATVILNGIQPVYIADGNIIPPKVICLMMGKDYEYKVVNENPLGQGTRAYVCNLEIKG